MPLYLYECQECGKTVEIFCKVKNNTIISTLTGKEPNDKCYKCKGNMKRILGSSNFIVNGYNEKNGYSRK